MFYPSDHTFVVCAYKDNPYITQTIESLKNQTVLGDIIISTSTPSDYLKNVSKDTGVRLIVNEHPHLAGNDWNYGYNYAQTPLVTIAHQDDLYHPEYLESFLKELNTYSRDEVTLAFSDYNELRNGETISDNTLLNIKRILNTPFTSATLNDMRVVKRRILSIGNPICCPAAMIVKENVGEDVFDTTYVNSCDYKTWVDLATRSGRFLYIPKELMSHRIYEESATTRNIESNVRSIEDLEILETLWPKPIAKLINSFYVKSELSNKIG